MSLIDKDKLGLTDFEIVSCKDYKEVLQKLLNKIDSAEVIDAVPVVRCKDCKKRGNYFENINEYACLRKGYLTDVKPPNWFCADGERSENATN